MKNIEQKVQRYRLLKTEHPIKYYQDDAGAHVYINDKWIDKVEIDLAIQQLPPKERTIINMLYIKGIPARRASILLNVDRSTIWRREQKAIRKLIRLLFDK